MVVGFHGASEAFRCCSVESLERKEAESRGEGGFIMKRAEGEERGRREPGDGSGPKTKISQPNVEHLP